MRRCPHCHEATLGRLASARSTKRRPMTCPHCHGLSFATAGSAFLNAFVVEVLFWLCFAVALWAGASWPLIAAIAGTAGALFALALAKPLQKLEFSGDKVQFSRPSKFYPDRL